MHELMNWKLKRRGFELGTVTPLLTSNDDSGHWQLGKPCLLKGACLDSLSQYQKNIDESAVLYNAILEGRECDQLLDQPPYSTRLDGQFESLGSSINEGDEQEIETVLFDALEQDEIVAEDLWMKASWLSFHEEDASLRFRFSFGVDQLEDVAADKHRQGYAAQLTDAIFPESRVITQNPQLAQTLKQLINSEQLYFVERIIYFNSPNGGAYLHHDRERGHAGVVYAQLSGQTYWLALPKQMLLTEIVSFVERCEHQQRWPELIKPEQRAELIALASDIDHLSKELETFANNTVIHLINQTQAFVEQLIAAGHGRLVETGDVLLLAQESQLSCCWHSVFNLGEASGQALSFAIRGQ